MLKPHVRPLMLPTLLVLVVACNGADSTGPATLTITADSLPAATQATAYSEALSASGGESPYTWSVVAGALPAGLSLAANGQVTGTPTGGLAPSSFAVRVTSADNQTADQALSMETLPLSFRAEGIVSNVPAALSASFAVGDTFAVTYAFDVATPDVTPATDVGSYSAVTTVEIRVGSYSCQIDTSLLSSPSIRVENDRATGADDRYSINLFERTETSDSGPLLGCPDSAGLHFGNQQFLVVLYDPSDAALPGDLLPIDPTFIDAFPSGPNNRRMYLTFYDPSSCDLSSCITSLIWTDDVESIEVVPTE